jgi:uncharacterized protein (TIGR02145 family)
VISPLFIDGNYEGKLTTQTGSWQNMLFSENPVQDGLWHMATLTYAGPNTPVKLYLDGVLQGETDSLTLITHSSPLYIGDAPWAVLFFDGIIDDVAIWNHALTAAQIEALFLSAAPIYGCTDPTACNFNEESTWNDDTCEYGCLNCGPGTVWNDSLSLCLPSTSICGEGTIWDASIQACVGFNDCPSDLDGDGLIGVEDLLSLLSDFGTDCVASDDPESAEWTCGDPVSYHGYDYATVQIGEQCWFAENLRAENYRNGEQIASNEYSTNALEFGVLYRGAVLIADQNVCPAGWSVTSDNDWLELELFLGAESSEVQLFEYSDERLLGFGDELKLSSSNQLGFNAAFGGYLNGPDAIEATDVGVNGQWWTSTFSEDDGNLAIYRNLESWTSGISRIYQPISSYGFSIRCIKD